MARKRSVFGTRNRAPNDIRSWAAALECHGQVVRLCLFAGYVADRTRAAGPCTTLSQQKLMISTALDTTMAAPPVTATAPAKLNLTLDVLKRRDDGYHELKSLVVGVDLCDQVCCRLGDTGEGVKLTCSDPTLCGDSNLACLAAQALAKHVGCTPAVHIEIDKRIPIAAGLGGGSSDAATTLRLCNELWGSGLDNRSLAAIGAEVGSDVPLFFSLPGAVMSGRGERVEPVTMRWSGWVLLAFLGESVSTVEVYRAWRPNDARRLPVETDRAIAQAATAEEMSPMLSNHLEPAVFRVCDAVGRAFRELNRAGLGPMRVCGAGSTLYRLFDEKEAACRTAGRIGDLGMGITTTVVAAPAAPSLIVGKEC